MAATQSTSGVTPQDRQAGDIVTVELLGEKHSGEIVDDVGLTACYGPGPEYVWVVDVVGAGSVRVSESDIVEPT